MGSSHSWARYPVGLSGSQVFSGTSLPSQLNPQKDGTSPPLFGPGLSLLCIALGSRSGRGAQKGGIEDLTAIPSEHPTQEPLSIS